MTPRSPTILLLPILFWCAPGVAAQEPASLGESGSAFVRRHADDAVEWMTWGEAAFTRALREDKPIFLSSGYLASGACRLMDADCFQQEGGQGVATILNRAFVPVILDREERPDVDRVYLEACRGLNQGTVGWPLTAVLAPNRKPFFATTFLAREDRGTRPGLKSMLLRIEAAWQRRATGLRSDAARVTETLASMQADGGPAALPPDLSSAAVDALLAAQDATHGGFGDAPRFPRPAAPALLLRVSTRLDRPAARKAALRQLAGMAAGGIRDHLGGGFHRYAQDVAWIVPEFEKHLADQALLADLYLDAWRVTGDAEQAAICREILDFCLEELALPGGGFATSLSADAADDFTPIETQDPPWTLEQYERALTPGYYTWSRDELQTALTPAQFEALAAWSDLTPGGTWRGNERFGRSVLHAARDRPALARVLDCSESDAAARLAAALARLRERRAGRLRPVRDEQLVVTPNALLVSALARAGAALHEPRYLAAARGTLKLILDRLVDGDGRLSRVLSSGRPHEPAQLSDHAALALACLDLHAIDLDPALLARAGVLAGIILTRFGPEDGSLVDSDAADLLFRTRETFDGDIPSGTSLAALAWARLGHTTGDEAWLAHARKLLGARGEAYNSNPAGHPAALMAHDLLVAPVARVQVCGEAARGELLPQLLEGWHPFVVVTVGDGQSEPGATVMVGDRMVGRATEAPVLVRLIAEALVEP